MAEQIVETLREQLPGFPVQHSRSGQVPCMGDSEYGEWPLESEDCQRYLTSGDKLFIQFRHNKESNNWTVQYRFCKECAGSEIDPGSEIHGACQILVRSNLQQTGLKTPEGYCSEGLTLIDSEVVDISPPEDGHQIEY